MERKKFSLPEIVRDRLLNKNKNWLCVIVGQTGSGKSYSALRLAEAIDPNFNIKQIGFKAKEFMNIINSGETSRGSIVVFDEAGVGMSSREWYTISNKMLGFILQTFRRDNIGVIFTVPSFSFIDSQARQLIHNFIQTMGINYQAKTCITKLHRVETNPRFGKVYMKYYRYFDGEIIKKVHPFYIGMPSKKLIEDYEEIKGKFADKLKKEVGAAIKLYEDWEYRKTLYKKLKQTIFKCHKCKYEWQPRTKNPHNCPNCGIKLMAHRPKIRTRKV